MSESEPRNSFRLGPIAFVGAAALVLGIAVAELAGYLPGRLTFLSQTWTPWLVSGFIAGSLFRRGAASVLAGVSVIFLGLGVYVVFKVTAYGGFSVRPLSVELDYFALYGTALGTIMGAAGALARDERLWVRAAGWGVPAAVATTETVAISTEFLPFGREVAAVVGAVAVLFFAIGATRATVARMAATTAVFSACGFGVFLLQRALPL